MKKLLFTIIAAVLSTPVFAASLTYEFRPDPFDVDEIVVWETGDGSTTTCDDPRIPIDFPGCSSEGYALAEFGPLHLLPFVTFETALMPFELAGHRVLLSSIPYYRDPGLYVFDRNDNVVFSLTNSGCCFPSNVHTEWLTSFSYGLAYTEIDLTFDQSGAISTWDIFLDSDAGQSAVYTNGLAYLREPGFAYGIPTFDFRMSNDGGGEWLINGVHQEEFISASRAVPLPASVLLLFGGLTSLGGLRAGRRLGMI